MVQPVRRSPRDPRRQAGVAAIMAMMFLAIFGSLAAAMAIVADGNLRSADSHIRVNRALSAAETGQRFMAYRIALVTDTVRTADGEINTTNAPALWEAVATELLDSMLGDSHLDGSTTVTFNAATGVFTAGPIRVGPEAGAPTFTATLTPHPLVDEDYNDPHYQRAPYDASTDEMALDAPVSSAAPLDARFVRLRVQGTDASSGQDSHRVIEIDLRLDKKVNFAILSKSRVMVGKNVMIQGRVGSKYNDVHLENGHPIQVESDWYGLYGPLDTDLDALRGSIVADDQNNDNRLDIYDSTETTGYANPENFDLDGDGYITEFDFVLTHFDSGGDAKITESELAARLGANDAEQLFRLIDTMGDPLRNGYDDGFIDDKDKYAKIRGEIHLTASSTDWNNGAAGGNYQDHLQGSISHGDEQIPLTFSSTEADQYSFEPSDFDVATFRVLASNDLSSQAGGYDDFVREEVPFGAAYPYDYYDRPVYRNRTFTNVTIPRGTNALFENCRFVGVTFVDTEVNNTDPDFNYAGMQFSDGTPKHPDRSATVGGTDVADTKTISNNIRFHSCTFEGAVVTEAPTEYTQVRNKIAFTGTTRFRTAESVSLTDEEKKLYQRSSILMPHYSLELGTFIAPYDSTETIELTGAIVAGLADLRGQVTIDGSLITTFEPINNTGPVIGETSPNFNTTLGYFSRDDGDLESEEPGSGWGVIQVRYDPSLALPDGITGPVELEPISGTYREGGV